MHLFFSFSFNTNKLSSLPIHNTCSLITWLVVWKKPTTFDLHLCLVEVWRKRWGGKFIFYSTAPIFQRGDYLFFFFFPHVFVPESNPFQSDSQKVCWLETRVMPLCWLCWEWIQCWAKCDSSCERITVKQKKTQTSLVIHACYTTATLLWSSFSK